jgi:hypothetical protein
MSTPSACGQRFLVEQLGKGHGHLDLVAIKTVGHSVHDRHGAGQGELHLLVRVRAGQLRLESMHAAFQAQWCHHLGHHGVIAVVTDAHLDFVLEVDALDLFKKAVHKMLTRLFAIANHFQTRVFLQFDPQERGVGFGTQERVAIGLPLRPELVGFCQPGGFGQAASDGGAEHGFSL